MWMLIKSKLEELLISPTSSSYKKRLYPDDNDDGIKLEKVGSNGSVIYHEYSDYDYYNDMKLSKQNLFHHQKRYSPNKSLRNSNFFPLSHFVQSQITYVLSFFIFAYELWKKCIVFFFVAPIEMILDFFLYNMCFIYVTIPMMICSYVWRQILYCVHKICRRYELARKCLIHISEIIKLVEAVWKKTKNTTVYDLCLFVIHNIYEIKCSWIWPSNAYSATSSSMFNRTYSLIELSELLEYEELTLSGKLLPKNANNNNIMTATAASNKGGSAAAPTEEGLKLVTKKYMHHDIPFNPFKATIKVRKVVPLSTGGAIALAAANPNTMTNSNHAGHGSNSSSTSSHSYSRKQSQQAPSSALVVPPNKKISNTGTNSSASNHLFNFMELFQLSKTSSPRHQYAMSDDQADTDSLLNFETEMLSDSFLEQYSILNEADTPASFPPTPFSRAHVMNRSAERVNSVMFAARDKLRQAVQSISADAQSRQYAQENSTQGYYAVFDPKKTSENIALSCGSHCMMKIGNSSFCSSSQSMVPLITGNYVYFEFSITVSSNQSPSLALGLSPPDAPLNVMVGSWSRSISINTEGHLLMQGSQWSQQPSAAPPSLQKTQTAATAAADKTTSNQQKDKKSNRGGKKSIRAGATVGFLVFLPAEDEYESEGTQQQQQRATVETSASERRHRSASSPMPTTRSEQVPETASAAASSASQQQQSSDLVDKPYVFKIHVDGVPCEYSSDCDEAIRHVMSDIQRFNTPLFPTVSLLSNNTRIWCRFCEADIVYRSREMIGVESGVRVYCVDGSILIHESEQ